MPEFRCPFCGEMTPLRRIGYGWVGICCNSVIYNADGPPPCPQKENIKVDREQTPKQESS